MTSKFVKVGWEILIGAAAVTIVILGFVLIITAIL